MRLELDLRQCQDRGLCADLVPELFTMVNGEHAFRAMAEPDGTARRTVSQDLEESLVEAVDACPMQAIRVID